MRIGIFGGTFNPPHLGHRSVAEAALAHGLDRVYAVPMIPYTTKQGEQHTSIYQRLVMLELMMLDHPNIQTYMDHTPLFSATHRTMCGLIRGMLREHVIADDEVSIILGSDLWPTVKTWEHIEEYPIPVKFIIAHRVFEEIALEHPTLEMRATHIRHNNEFARSSLIREMIDTHQPGWEAYTGYKVANYVNKYHLYR